MTPSSSLVLVPAARDEFADLVPRIQAAFAIAVVENTGADLTEPIPSDAEVWESFDDPHSEILHVVATAGGSEARSSASTPTRSTTASICSSSTPPATAGAMAAGRGRRSNSATR